MRERPPAFQFYPKDFLTSERQIAMSATAAGVYIRLLCHCWLSRTLPNDPAILAKLAGVSSEEFDSVSVQVLACFSLGSDERLFHARLNVEMRKQAKHRQAQREKGLLSAAGRQPRFNHGSTTVQPEGNSSSSSSSSSSSAEKHREKSASASVIPINGTTDPELADRAGRFCERYAELYQQHRRGARYLPRPALDFTKAVELCTVWPNDRLDMMAAVFLSTDHEFAASGSRTIGQFAALASYCDGRLREVESA